MNTYYIGLDNMVAVESETEERAREVAIEELIEILQREKDVVLNIEMED
jgi:hypothetical protein